jgi:hypothetical protein
MPKDQCKATGFVELVNDSQLLQFMDKVSCAILMEDGAPVHRHKVLEEWRKLHLLGKLEWPANSPNLNLLENVWKLIKDAIQHGQFCPKTLEELKVTLEREWKLVGSAKLCTLRYSMPTRLQLVIEAK